MEFIVFSPLVISGVHLCLDPCTDVLYEQGHSAINNKLANLVKGMWRVSPHTYAYTTGFIWSVFTIQFTITIVIKTKTIEFSKTLT